MFDTGSMPTVAELVADPDLGLALVAGGADADNEIEAAAVSELAHPGPWLQGGELLLTIGLLLPDDVDGCRSYLAELKDAGVRAVGLGLGGDLPYQAAPERLVVAADQVGIPLVTVPDPVPFIAVTKAVFAQRARAERRELEWALQTQRALTAAAVTPGGLLGILAAHREATAAPESRSICWAGSSPNPIRVVTSCPRSSAAYSPRFATVG